MTQVCAQDQKIAGTFFGKPVPYGNYMFILRIVISYQSPWGGIPRTREQAEKRVWEDLILSYEAHQREISVNEGELAEKITRTLKSEGATFDWQQDPESFKAWLRDRLNISVEGFESQMRHLLQVQKLHEQILNSINPVVTYEEALQEFRNERNTLSVELAEFETNEDAQAFYAKVMEDAEAWENASKADKELVPEDRAFRKPGFVALEFLMDMWKFPQEAVYDMVAMKTGEFYPPTPIYEGFGVFKILEVRRADDSEFPQQKESYDEQLKQRKRYQGFRQWLEKIQEDARIEKFVEVPIELYP